jgi:glycosyltransferase involved in cell wall biosynthesis
MELPHVSIIVLTRNRAESLLRTLKALFILDYPSYEIVVVDNGSTDETCQIARQFAAKYMFCPPQCGMSLCRQKGVDAAEGTIIAMCDDDCVPESSWLTKLVQDLISEDNLGLVGGHVINIGFPEHRKYKGRSKLGINGTLSLAADPKDADFFGSANMAFKREAAAQIGGYDPFLKSGNEEADLIWSLRDSGWRVSYEPEAIVKHYFTGPGYKKTYRFYLPDTMRLYVYLKHDAPQSLPGWYRFWHYELVTLFNQVKAIPRKFVGAFYRGNFKRCYDLARQFYTYSFPRLSVPWLLWRIYKRRHEIQNHVN